MTNVNLTIDDKTLVLHETSASAAEAAADRAEAAVDDLSRFASEIYVNGTSLIINTGLSDGNEVSY